MIPTFKIVSLLEGISYILLLFIAVPIKYLQHNEAYVKMLGMPHGMLFVGYIIIAYLLKDHFKWDNKTFLKVCALSIVPLGTFFVNRFMKPS